MENLHLKNLDLTKVREQKLRQLYDDGYTDGYKNGCDRFNKTVDNYDGARKPLKFSYPHSHAEYRRGYRDGFNNGFDSLEEQYKKDNPDKKKQRSKTTRFFHNSFVRFHSFNDYGCSS